jgi:hypothetical protein
VQCVFSHHARRFGDEQRQEIERLRREMNLIAVSQQLPTLCIDLVTVRIARSQRIPRIPLNLPRCAPDLKAL